MRNVIKAKIGDRIEYEIKAEVDPSVKRHNVGTIMKESKLGEQWYVVRADGLPQMEIVVFPTEVIRVIEEGSTGANSADPLPMTDEERALARRLERCSMLPGSHEKRFARDMAAKALQEGEVLERDNGQLDPAQLDVAALPCHRPALMTKQKGVTNQEGSTRMMLFMLRDALKGMWFMRQLAPGFLPLMPFLLVSSEGKTLSQLYAEQGVFSKLLPSPEADFIDGEVIQISEV